MTHRSLKTFPPFTPPSETHAQAPVVGAHQIIVGRVGESEGQHTLLLKVGFMDSGKGLDYDRHTYRAS
jgi:hypothetical protein